MPRAVLESFHSHLDKLDRTRERMESLYGAERITLRDLHVVYEALFLRAVTGFQAFLEHLFIGILERSIRYQGNRVSLRMRVDSADALRDILHRDAQYLEWLPLDKTLKRARLYLGNGAPFTDLDDAEIGMVKRIHTTRNAIAHSSNHATEKFRAEVIGERPMLRGERTPAGFLRSQVRGGAAQNRYQSFSFALGNIAAKLC